MKTYRRGSTQIVPPRYMNGTGMKGSILNFGEQVKDAVVISSRTVRRPAAEVRRFPWRRRVRFETSKGGVLVDVVMRYRRASVPTYDEEMLFLPCGVSSPVDVGVTEDQE